MGTTDYGTTTTDHTHDQGGGGHRH
jgi:hypothetical protein